MPMHELFKREFDVEAEMLVDFLQQALAAMPTVTSHQLADSGDCIEFRTSFTWTSWGDNMVAEVQPADRGRAVVKVSGEPRAAALSTPWGEEMHAATIEAQLFGAIGPLVQAARTNPFAMLQADHRRVETLFARIRGAEADERAQLVQELVAALRVHMDLEENHVYPLIQQEVNVELGEEAEAEHQLARDGLAQLEELTPEEPGFDAALVMVVAGIEYHVMEEENDAFPRLAIALGPERLAQLADQLVSARADLLSGKADTGKGQSARARDKQAHRPPRPKRQSRGAHGRRERSKVNPDEATRADLVAQAKKAGVAGYSHMTKADLAKALNRS